MILEQTILISVTVISALSLLFIPRNKWLLAQWVFAFVQFPTWVLGLSVVELRLLEYPVRELAEFNRTSFIFEYLILPILCIHVNVHHPLKAGKLMKHGLYCCISLILSAVEWLLERYTDVIHYTGWQWYWTWIGIWFILWLSRSATVWFFRQTL